MARALLDFDAVIGLGRKLPEVVESLHYGAQALKWNGRMLACTPMNKSAEVNSAVVAIDFERRAALLKKNPSCYYITDHYVPHPAMLVRLSRISRDELERILQSSRDYLASKKPARQSPAIPGVRPAKSRASRTRR